MRTIDADALLEKICRLYPSHPAHLSPTIDAQMFGFCNGVSNALLEVDRAPTIDAEPVRQGCEYCSGRRTEYYHTTNTKLYINTFGNAQVLETECNPCPPYSNCSLRGIPVRSAFIINYCPNCGRKLDGGANDAAD